MTASHFRQRLVYISGSFSAKLKLAVASLLYVALPVAAALAIGFGKAGVVPLCVLGVFVVCMFFPLRMELGLMPDRESEPVALDGSVSKEVPTTRYGAKGAAEQFILTVNALKPEIGSIYGEAQGRSIGEWKAIQNSMVTGSGAAAVAIPGLHLLGLAADVALVVNRMGVSTFGIGAIRGSSEGLGNILEHEDFGAVLGYWADDDDLREAMTGKATADLASKFGYKAAQKAPGKSAARVLTKMMLSSTGYMVGRELGGKGLAKAAAKFSGRFARKGVAGFVPFLGPAVGGGVNLWLNASIMNAADEFYSDKIALIRRIDGGEFG